MHDDVLEWAEDLWHDSYADATAVSRLADSRDRLEFWRSLCILRDRLDAFASPAQKRRKTLGVGHIQCSHGRSGMKGLTVGCGVLFV
jgi:hypothetical protein